MPFILTLLLGILLIRLLFGGLFFGPRRPFGGFFFGPRGGFFGGPHHGPHGHGGPGGHHGGPHGGGGPR